MILTQCAACARPISPTAPRCARCHTRYCGPTCQKEHWEGGGHSVLCKKIKRRGGAEQYHADKKCEEAIAVAAEACAEDTAGQTCYICTQAVHWKTKEGLVRMCACRGTAGFAHVSCLAEQAKIFVAEAEENNLDWKVLDARFHRWDTCGLCEQSYHGVVRGALGWACWKTYLGRPETDWAHRTAMSMLGNGLEQADLPADALLVLQSLLTSMKRFGDPGHTMLTVENAIAGCLCRLKRNDEALVMRRELYTKTINLLGTEHRETIVAANNLAQSLMLKAVPGPNILWTRDNLGALSVACVNEARALLSKTVPASVGTFGPDHEFTIGILGAYASTFAIFHDGESQDELAKALAMTEDVCRRTRQILGVAHPMTKRVDSLLMILREKQDGGKYSPSSKAF